MSSAASVPSLDLASVNNSMKIQALNNSNNDILLKVNDQILLENTDLKAQLKAFRKGGIKMQQNRTQN